MKTTLQLLATLAIAFTFGACACDKSAASCHGDSCAATAKKACKAGCKDACCAKKK